MGRAGLILAIAAVLLATGCGQTISGTATGESPGTAPVEPSRETVAQAVPNGSAPAPADGPLVGDVIADECLLNATEFTALLGTSVQPAQATSAPNASIKVPSCVATTTAGPATPVGVVNVYTIRGSTPAEYVRGRPGRELTGVGEAARLIRTGTSTVLQAARGPFLVTISALRGAPTDAAWRAAGGTALSRLPG